jgi:hypothetical protein
MNEYESTSLISIRPRVRMRNTGYGLSNWTVEFDLTNGLNRKRILSITLDILGGLGINKGGLVMGNQIQWEASLTTTKAKAKKGKKLILMDFYNNL